MDAQEISDRADITEVLVRYTRAVDGRRWAELDGLFTADARIDYTAFGGIAADLAGAKRFLAESMAMFAVTQHMLGLSDITFDGDRARAVTPCHNPMVLTEESGGSVMVCSLWYHHELVRTPEGWRIAALHEEKVHMTVLPGRSL